MKTTNEETTREDHLKWCKERALKINRTGDTREAFTSMCSDLGKHPETADHMAMGLGLQLMMGGSLSSVSEMEKFINGFN